ncbi:hypothetical protein AAFF_G00414840 [Aldrovandia affinis]|uniref:Uncharacterized protein n=1 Tax=Aldrovandia affinis TaxID=143900 RepID=A0AAD7WJM3_9TELE|nr:hypothetical protein AAFF_G00414840 [Aldrovandia affinis]
MDTATIQLADVADMDFRVTIQKLDGHDDLTKEEKDDVNNLALFWDLPVVNTTNRSWLFQKLLQHAVIGRTKRQIKQIRRGLKDTRVLELLIERPDTVPLIFPRSANIAPSAQAILSNIVWPGEEAMEMMMKMTMKTLAQSTSGTGQQDFCADSLRQHLQRSSSSL